MATLGPNYVTGITTSVNATDIAFKEYVDNHTGGITATTDSDNGKLLVSDGSTSSWDYLSARVEFQTPGTTNYTVPSRVNKLLISASGGGGGGGVGEIDGTTVPKLTSWTQRTGSFNSYSYYYYGSITYGDSPSGNKWVNTGQSARVESSTDSIHWTTRTHGNSNNNSYWWDGIYANNEFLLVGYNYSVSASTDAIHWFARTANAGSVQYNTINYGADGNYCIAGDSGRILSSTDAIHWTTRTGTTTSENKWVGYLNNDWHMCGSSNTYSVSTDTIHWTARTIGNTMQNVTMSYHAGQQTYLMFKQNAYYSNDSVSTGHGIWASTDSITWVARTSDFGGRTINYQFFASEYVPSIQTVVACGSYVSVVSSTDTIHWTYSKSDPEQNGSEENFDIATDDSERVLITGRYYVMIRNSPLKNYGISGGGGGGAAAPRYEINGNDISKNSTLDVTVGAGGRGGGKVHSQQWTLRTLGISSNRLEENGYPAVKYGGYWVVGSKLSASTDSIHWSARTLPLPASTQAWGVAYGDLLLMTSGDNYFLCTSTDSIVWTLRTTSLDNNKEMFYDGIGTWLVAGGPFGGTPNGLVVSTDTIHWTRRTLGANPATQTGFAFNGDDTYVLGTYNSGVAKSNGLSSSTDTIHWTLRTLGFGSLNTKKVNYSYATNNFYIVGESNSLLVSTDAIHWAKRTVPFANTNTIYSYSTGYNQHVIGSEDGIATSTDSIHWTLRTHNFTEAGPRYIGYGDEKFIVTNGSGSPNYTDEIAILDVSSQDGEDTIVSWKGKGDADLTIGGDVSVSTSVKPTGASSSYSFDGSTEYLSLADSADFSFGTGDYTMEAWIYPTSTGTYPVIIAQYENTSITASWFFSLGDTTTTVEYYAYSPDGNLSPQLSGGTAPLNTWTHVAVTRSGSTVRLFVGGSQVDSRTWSNAHRDSSLSVTIGASSNGLYKFSGNISNVRIVKGKAIYTEAFTPPTPDLQFTDRTVLLTCNGSDVSALDAQQTYSITVSGGNAASKNTGGSRLVTSDVQNGYVYLPTALDSTTGTGNIAFGLGGDGSSGNSSFVTSYAYQGPSGGGAGGSALYPSASYGAPGQRTYFGQSYTGSTANSDDINGDDGGRIRDYVYGTGAYGGSAASKSDISTFKVRTFYGMSGYTSQTITGNYIDYLDLFVLASNTTSNTESTTHLQVSTDTIHWTLRTYPFPGNNGYYNWISNRDIVHRPIDSDGTQVLLSNTNWDNSTNSHTLASSTDTIHWTLRTAASASTNPSIIQYGNNTWVQAYYNTPAGLSTSTDAIHWTLRTFGFSNTALIGLVYGNGRWVGTIAGSGSPVTSTDAIHWKLRTAPLSNSYVGHNIIYTEPSDGENIFVYGNYRHITWSTDGINWTARTQSQMHYVYSLAYSPSTNKYLVYDYYSRVFVFDASGALEDLFPLNTGYDTSIWNNNYYSPYHAFSNDKINAMYIGSNYYYVVSNIMGVYMGNGGNGGPGAGGGGASIISKSSLSGHGGDGGDGSVHISMI